MSYAIQSCCSISRRNQLLRMVSATDAVMVRKTACIDGAAVIWPKQENFKTYPKLKNFEEVLFMVLMADEIYQSSVVCNPSCCRQPGGGGWHLPVNNMSSKYFYSLTLSSSLIINLYNTVPNVSFVYVNSDNCIYSTSND